MRVIQSRELAGLRSNTKGNGEFQHKMCLFCHAIVKFITN